MTFINVDPATYYEAATIVNQAATAFFTAYAQQLKGLETTNAMAGSAGPGRDWAVSYDEQVRNTNNLVTALTMLADRYTSALNQIGHTYALGDHNPTSGSPPPAKPPNPPLAFSSCPVPPPSAGGPGSGLVDDGLDLAKKIGIDLPVPDGDTDKLHTAATVWKTLAAAPEITNLPTELERAAALFQTVTAPEVATIDDDLRTLKTAAEDLIAIFTDLAGECAHQRTAHDNMKGQLSDALNWFAIELGKEVAVTAALAVAASLISFGVGSAAVTAVRAGKFANLVTKIVERLRGIVTAAGLRKLVTLTRNTTDTRTKLERLHDAIETAEDTVEAGTPQPTLAQKLAAAQVWPKGNLPVINGPPNGYLVKKDADGNITNYSYYDADGVATSRVDLTGKPHMDKQTGQYIPTPHVVEVQKNVNPKTGEVYAKTLSDTVRPALPQEIP
ncbi:polymorphic toxin type 24 domain-containing protein [Nocardia carnea]|uniref:polymorphic toxin type 24 domain-containing protein n=1 Tax=Nocardia carnea TaxID=37328 RepID=UPI00245470C4|nr:polymorphic toxin type 24 domain-containing protein [Nocardia carnea]